MLKMIFIVASLFSALAFSTSTVLHNVVVSKIRTFENEEKPNHNKMRLSINGSDIVGENPKAPGTNCTLYTRTDALMKMALTAKLERYTVDISYTGPSSGSTQYCHIRWMTLDDEI